jgi:glycosyltransferase involved in cell wall biosynthesis
MEISIVMTTYNGVEYISEQLESVITQSRKPDEILVIDDGSTDGTLQILHEFRSSHPGLIKVYENDRNLGVEKNFEKGLQLASGDIVAVADQDDIWDERKIEKQEAFIIEQDVDLVFHDALLFSEESGTYGTLWESLGLQPSEFESSDAIFSNLLAGNFVQGASMALTQEVLEYALPIPERVKYDYFIALSVASRGKVGFLDERLSKYRQHEDQDVGVGADGIVDRLTSYSLPTKPKIISEIESNIVTYETLRERLSSRTLSQDEDELLKEAQEHYRQRLELYHGQESNSIYPIANTKKYAKYDNMNAVVADIVHTL